MFAFVEKDAEPRGVQGQVSEGWEPWTLKSMLRSGKYGSWFGQDSVRVVEYWRRVPVTKSLLLLSDGRTVDKAELTPRRCRS